jgi:hypothetical protein
LLMFSICRIGLLFIKALCKFIMISGEERGRHLPWPRSSLEVIS